jgi:hypothetical protein
MEMTQNSVDQFMDFMGPNKRNMPILNRPDIEDSQDMDSDDEIRKKLLSSRSDERDLMMTKDEFSNNFSMEEPMVIPRLEDVKLTQSQMSLEELTESDLIQIVGEIVELEEVYENGNLTIDWGKHKHVVLLEVLSSKIMPKLQSVVLDNMESEQEVVAKFLYLSLQKGVDSLILNDNLSPKIVFNYYIVSLQFLLKHNLISTSLTIKEVEMSSQIFELLLNSAIECPIILDLGWISVHKFEEFTITVPEGIPRSSYFR